jgi:hypothetical protein
MSILAHDWLEAFRLYAGFMSPLQGLLVGGRDPGAAARLQRALPRAIPFRPYRGSGPFGAVWFSG